MRRLTREQLAAGLGASAPAPAPKRDFTPFYRDSGAPQTLQAIPLHTPFINENMKVKLNRLIPGSYSKLGTYEKCPAQAKYRYIDLRPAPKTKQMQRGTDLHASAESFVRGKKTTIRKELAPLAQTLIKVRTSDPQVEVKLAFSRWFKDTIEWSSKNAWFRLVLDSIYAEPETSTLHVQEWKSGKEYDDHEDQREIYGALSLVEWKDYKQAEVTTYYIDKKITRPLRVDSHHAKLILDKLNGRLERMGKDTVFPPRPGHYCNWCPFSHYKGGPCRVG